MTPWTAIGIGRGAVLLALVLASQACARTDLFGTDFLVATDESCATPGGMYAILPATTEPQIGAGVSSFADACAITVDSATTGTSGTYRILWSERALYILVQVSDAALEATATARDESTWQDDSLEIGFDTLGDGGDEMHLDDYKFGVNLFNTQYDCRGVGWRDPPWDMTFSSAVAVDGTINDGSDTDAGYFIQVELPFASWGITPPVAGTQWRMSVILDDCVSGVINQTAWVGPPDNAPDQWGVAVFVGP